LSAVYLLPNKKRTNRLQAIYPLVCGWKGFDRSVNGKGNRPLIAKKDTITSSVKFEGGGYRIDVYRTKLGKYTYVDCSKVIIIFVN
jgi:hypothetical protein